MFNIMHMHVMFRLVGGCIPPPTPKSATGSGLASDLSSSYDSRSGTGTPTMISKFASLAKQRAKDLVWNGNIKLPFTFYGLQ